MVLDLQTVLSLLVAMVFPVLNGLITRWHASVLRTYLQLLFAAVVGFVGEWLAHLNAGDEYDWRKAALVAVMALVTAIATQAGVWAPLGVSTRAKLAGVSGKTPATVSRVDRASGDRA